VIKQSRHIFHIIYSEPLDKGRFVPYADSMGDLPVQFGATVGGENVRGSHYIRIGDNIRSSYICSYTKWVLALFKRLKIKIKIKKWILYNKSWM
jgi:hypothetical protein